MKVRNLEETKTLYWNFSNVDKLRIWNLFLMPTVIIPSDIQKVLGLTSSVFIYLKEFLESGLVTVDVWGKRKVYFFTNEESRLLIENTISSINDQQLEKDRTLYYEKMRGGLLQISGWNWGIKNGRVNFFKTIKKSMLKTYEIKNVNDWLNKFALAIKHNRKDQIAELKTELSKMNVMWDEFPKELIKYNKLLSKIL